MSLRNLPPSPAAYGAGDGQRSNQRRRERSRSRDRYARERENPLWMNEPEDIAFNTAGPTCNCFDCQQFANAERDRDWSVRYPGQSKQAFVEMLRILDESLHSDNDGASSPPQSESSTHHFADDQVFTPVEPPLYENACEYTPIEPPDEGEAATEGITDESSDEAWAGENVSMAMEVERVPGENR